MFVAVLKRCTRWWPQFFYLNATSIVYNKDGSAQCYVLKLWTFSPKEFQHNSDVFIESPLHDDALQERVVIWKWNPHANPLLSPNFLKWVLALNSICFRRILRMSCICGGEEGFHRALCYSKFSFMKFNSFWHWLLGNQGRKLPRINDEAVICKEFIYLNSLHQQPKCGSVLNPKRINARKWMNNSSSSFVRTVHTVPSSFSW